VEVEKCIIKSDSGKEHELTSSPVVVHPFVVAVLIKVSSILRELFLGVNVLKSLGRFPPLRASLDKHIIGL
jgi:hypothetical protein